MNNFTKDIQISKVDQENINAFSKLHLKNKELMEEIKLFDDKVDKIVDCGDEIEMEDDDAKMQIRMGDGFIFCTIEEARGMFETDKGTYQKELDARRVKAKEMKEKMNELKRSLYAKFGNKIRLEED